MTAPEVRPSAGKPRVALHYPLPPGRLPEAVAHCAACPWPTGWDDGVHRLASARVFSGDGLLVRFLELEPLKAPEDGAAEAQPAVLLGLLAAALDVPGVVAAELPLVRSAGLVPGVPGRGGPHGRDERALLRAAHARMAVTAFAGRVTRPALLPGDEVRRRFAAVRYPARPGQGAAIAQALTGGRDLPVNGRPAGGGGPLALASTSLFRWGDTVVRLIEVAGEVSQGMEHLRRTASRGPGAQRLAGLLLPGYDLRTAEGFDRFLATGTLRPVDRPALTFPR